MTSNKQILNSQYFNAQETAKDREGLILDYQNALESLPNDTGQDYIKQSDYRLQSGIFRNAEVVKQRSEIAEPKIIATFDPHDTSDLPDITSDGFRVKNKGDDFIALPSELETALPKVHAAALDLLKLYGEDTFKEAEITFVLQRNDIEQGQAPRPHFAGWHNHINGGEKTDILYLFHDVLGTEFQLNHHEGEPIETIETGLPDNVLSRIGGEIMHRSKPENPHDTLRREWGGLKVTIDKQPISASQNGRSNNLSMVGRDSPLFEKFSQAAQNIIERQNSVHAFTQPKNVIGFAPAELEHS